MRMSPEEVMKMKLLHLAQLEDELLFVESSINTDLLQKLIDDFKNTNDIHGRILDSPLYRMYFGNTLWEADYLDRKTTNRGSKLRKSYHKALKRKRIADRWGYIRPVNYFNKSHLINCTCYACQTKTNIKNGRNGASTNKRRGKNWSATDMRKPQFYPEDN